MKSNKRFRGTALSFQCAMAPGLSMVMDINTEIHYYRYYEKHGFRLLGFNALLGVRLFLDSDESLSKGSPKTQHENQTMKYQQTSEMN